MGRLRDPQCCGDGSAPNVALGYCLYRCHRRAVYVLFVFVGSHCDVCFDLGWEVTPSKPCSIERTSPRRPICSFRITENHLWRVDNLSAKHSCLPFIYCIPLTVGNHYPGGANISKQRVGNLPFRLIPENI